MQQLKRRRFYGYGVVILRDVEWTCELYWRTSRGWTLLGALLIVINSCVLNFECNKVPLWTEPSSTLQYKLRQLFFPLYSNKGKGLSILQGSRSLYLLNKIGSVHSNTFCYVNRSVSRHITIDIDWDIISVPNHSMNQQGFFFNNSKNYLIPAQVVLTLWSQSLSKQYSRVQSVPPRKQRISITTVQLLDAAMEKYPCLLW
jgi:hypothetical protein